ncbi:MAG: methyltransferase domain-containing protein [Deltaproteobacteria bacterium]|nr:methyltransferase domain-containing protein [Deltaproteobacteria bacterium]
MSMTGFVGSIPELYDRHMGPVLFEPYAHELVKRLPRGRILEVAAGTGRVTRRIAERGDEVVATDLNGPMLDEARKHTTGNVTWQVADAQALPFPDASFDAVACAFGLMFVPDKPLALREMRRVLRPGGKIVLSVWDSHAKNPASQTLHTLACELMPDNAPTFMAIPFSLHDAAALQALTGGQVETVAILGVAESAASMATGFVRGNPLYNQLVERGIDAAAFQARVEATLAERFGDRPCRTPMSAHLVVA